MTAVSKGYGILSSMSNFIRRGQRGHRGQGWCTSWSSWGLMVGDSDSFLSSFSWWVVAVPIQMKGSCSLWMWPEEAGVGQGKVDPGGLQLKSFCGRFPGTACGSFQKHLENRGREFGSRYPRWKSRRHLAWRLHTEASVCLETYRHGPSFLLCKSLFSNCSLMGDEVCLKLLIQERVCGN